MNCHPEQSEGPAVRQPSARSAPLSSRFRTTVGQDPIVEWDSVVDRCVQDGLLEKQGATVRLTGRGRLLSNEVFARFLIQETAETKVGTGHVKSR